MADLREQAPPRRGDGDEPPRQSGPAVGRQRPRGRWIALAVVVLAIVGGAVAAIVVTTTGGGHKAAGVAPPEWAANANAWPAFGHDLANTRATTRSSINSSNVSKLKVKWTFAFKGASAFGAFSSTPIVLGQTVYLQDLNSNVFALNRSTGKVKWEHAFNKPSIGPNGIAYGYGRIYGATETNAFALDPSSGKLLWSRKLINNSSEGIDMAPQLYDHTVLISTVPGAGITNFYRGGGVGIVHALDAASGKPKWSFDTVADGYKLWGNPKVNSGGGLWYPPAVDSKGRVFISVANPAPLYGTPKFPDGSSRPGPNLYTDSLVALDGQTGKLLWFRQAIAHDTRDYDLMIPAILTTVPVDGVKTEVVLVAGKMGMAYAYRASDGKHLWTRSVGRHQNNTGPLPKQPETIYPGDLGGVETPMALAGGHLFVPWVDYPTIASASGLSAKGQLSFASGRGGLAAIDSASGKIAWQQKLPSENFGGATVANDVVFTSTYAGRVYGFDVRTGKQLWSTQAPAGVNSFAAVDGDTVLVGAAASGLSKNPSFELVAYSLSGTGSAATPTPAPTTTSGGAAPISPGASANGIQVNGGEFFFKLAESSIPKPGTVTFQFKNVGHILHDFSIDGKKTPLIQPGQTAKLTVSFSKAGKYPYLCTVPGHAAAGMKGVFTVR
jgi:alcohol dehydrogenase (cytochrome c)